MKNSRLTVQEQVVIIRVFKDIGINSRLQAFHIPTAEALPPRFYNGRIAYQYKISESVLLHCEGNPRRRILITIHTPVLPFLISHFYRHHPH